MADEDDFPQLPAGGGSAAIAPVAPPLPPPQALAPAGAQNVAGEAGGRTLPAPPFPPGRSGMVVPAYEFPARLNRGVVGFAIGLLIGRWSRRR
jgi:hypothetical protein